MKDKNFLKNDEQFEDLQLDNLKIIQNRNLYRFTSDAVILANFIRAKSKDFLIDLGTGSGIIAILATYKNKLHNVLGIEFQKNLADMAQRSVIFNKLENRIKILNSDIKNLKVQTNKENTIILKNETSKLFYAIPNTKKIYLNKTADIVVCNPPYKKIEDNLKQSFLKEKGVFLNEFKNITKTLNKQRLNSKLFARHEIGIKMEELIKTVSSILKFGGKFYVVYDSSRLTELIFKLKKSKLEPKRILLTQPNETSKAILVFVEAVKGGKEGVEILPTLITNNKNGKYLNIIKNLK